VGAAAVEGGAGRLSASVSTEAELEDRVDGGIEDMIG
jgi:hypothetical protein